MLVAFNGLFGFNLGDDFGLGAFLAQELAELMDVVGALHEREGDIIKVAGGTPF